MGTLYLVATPIGNMEDITLRALRLLREVPLIAAEDTRTARILLKRHGIERARLTSYNDHNASAKTPALLRALGEGDMALTTDAGMPGISDPGHQLVEAVLAAGHGVVPVPGASAVTAAVAASGLASRRFHYLGFLPKAAGARRRALAEAAASADTLVLFESPHRMRAMLKDALTTLGDRRIAVCRELTKLHEEIWRGTVSGALAHFASPRGEFTLVLEGRDKAPGSAAAHEGTSAPDAIAASISALRAERLTAKDAVPRLMKAHDLSRRTAYGLWTKNRDAGRQDG